MLVDINQWRAAIGSFKALTSKSEKFCVQNPLAMLLQIFQCYLSAFCFTLISTTILPLTITIFSLLSLLSYSEPYFWQIFSKIYWSVKILICCLPKLLKRAYIIIIDFLRSKHSKINYFSLLYLQSYAACLAIDVLYFQWVVARLILLSCDVEPNPGPDTFKFCCWNLNSIIAHDFLRVALIEAYNSIYKYDLLGIVETHLNNSIDHERLALKGYDLIACNHPSNIKRSGVALYVKESLSKKHRPDMTTLSECIVCEIYLDRKNYFLLYCTEVLARTKSNLKAS